MSKKEPDDAGRRYEEKPLEADVSFEGQETLRCRVIELNPMGARLSRAGIPGSLHAGLGLHMGLRLPPRAEGEYMRIRGAVTRAGSGRVDVRFTKMGDGVQAAIRHYLATLERGRLAEGKRRRSTHLSKRIDDDARARLVSAVDEMVSDFFCDLGKALGRRSALAESDAERVRLTDDTALLERAGRDRAVKRALVAEILRTPRDRPENPREIGHARPLDDEQTDTWVAREALVNRLEQELRGLLAAIRECLGEGRDAQSGLSLFPEHLAFILEQALTRLGLSPESRVFGLRTAEKPLVEHLKTLYGDLLRALEGLHGRTVTEARPRAT